MKRNNKLISSALAVIMSMSVFVPTVQAIGDEVSDTGKKVEDTKTLESPFTTARVNGKGFEENAEVLATGGIVELDLFASKAINPEKIGVELKSNGQLISLGKDDFSVTGDLTKKKRTISINIPKNDTTEEKEYEIRFTDDKDSESHTYYDNVTVGVVQKAAEKNQTEITSFTANKNKLSELGGDVTLVIKGSNLDSEKLGLEIKNSLGRDVTTQVEKEGNKFEGNINLRTIQLHFPPILEGKNNEKYTINLKVDGIPTDVLTVDLEREDISDIAIESITPKLKEIDSSAQKVECEIKTKPEIKNSEIYSQIKCNDIYTSKNISITGEGDTRKAIIEIPENKSIKEKVYEVKFSNKKTYFSDKLKLTITQKVNENRPQIIFTNPDSIKLDAKGGSISFDVVTKNINKDNLGIKIKVDGEEKTIKDIEVIGEKDKKTVSMNIPENKTQLKKMYDITFYPKDEVNFVGGPTLNVVQEAAELKKEIVVNSFEPRIPELPSDGGTTSITAKGSNLESDRLSLKITKDGKDVTNEIIKSNNQFMGTENTMSTSLNFPKQSSEKDEKYTITLVVDGVEKNTTNVVVSKYGTNQDDTELSFKSVYLAEKNVIIMESYENIYEVREGNLKDNISIKIGNGKFEKLDKEDKVQIKDNIIMITLKNPIDESNLGINSKVRVERRVLKDSLNRPFKESESILNGFIPVVSSEEIIKGDILPSTGGDVEMVLNGSNLTKESTKVKVIKKQRLSSGKQEYIKNVTVEGEGKKQTIKFSLPANKTNRTESYSILISIDGGKTYTPEIGWNIFSRANRIAPAVLPEGKTKDNQTLGFMAIQSYGTTGGKEDGDNTHTNTPTNQESKKTFVHLYGTNLKKNKTKVRIINEETGVVFVPTNEPAKDSGDRFIMVGFDGTGVIGDGNHQQLEIIAPRGYRGDNKYIYQVAIDGVHFDKEMTVSATIIDDKEDPGTRPTPSEIVRDMSVKYVTTDGKEISPKEEHKVYKGQQLYTTEIMPKNIKGYKYLGMREVKEAKDRIKELESKRNNITESEKQELEKTKALFANVLNQKHHELELTYSNKPGKVGEITFLYEKENSTDLSSSDTTKSKDKDTKVSNANKVDRISGNDRYDTSLEISKKAYKKSDRVYLVSGEKFPDALATSSLTHSSNGPILLINDKNIDKILSEIGRLQAKEVVFVGGNSISKSSEEKIKSGLKSISTKKGYKVNTEKLVGKDRYKTAAMAAEKTINKFGNKGVVIIADGRNYPDAISVAPYASKMGLPIILTNGNKIDESAKKLLKKYNLKEAILVGGEKAVGKDIEKLFNKTNRIAGKDRYETSKKIAENLFVGNKKTFIASGESFADALSASHYAGMENAPIILTKSKKNSTKDYLKNKKGKLVIIGGEKALSLNLFEQK